MLSGFYFTLYKEIKSIPSLTSQAERDISFYGVTNHSFCWALALQETRISGSHQTPMDIFFVGFSGSLDRAAQVLQWREKVTSVLELVEKFWISNTISAPSVLGIPRVTKASKSFPNRSPLHTTGCSGSPHILSGSTGPSARCRPCLRWKLQ